MNKKFWMAGFLVTPKVYAVIASPFSLVSQKEHLCERNAFKLCFIFHFWFFIATIVLFVIESSKVLISN